MSQGSRGARGQCLARGARGQCLARGARGQGEPGGNIWQGEPGGNVWQGEPGVNFCSKPELSTVHFKIDYIDAGGGYNDAVKITWTG